MKAGNFNINDYLEKLYEEAETSGFMDGGEDTVNADGIVIPKENKKSYDWLKKEYQKGKVEVKVEMKLGGAKFEPGYDLQTDLKSVKDFKPGMYGEVKTDDTPGEKKPEQKNNLDAKKSEPSFTKKEGEKETAAKPENKEEKDKTKEPTSDIKDKEESSKEPEKEEKDEDDTKVKKIDLKTKK